MNIEKNKLMIGGIAGAILLLIVYLIYSSGPIVTADGQASIEVEPDIVSVYINIEGRGEDLQKAKAEYDEIHDKTSVELYRVGISDDEIELQSYNSYPEYDYTDGGQRLKGYVVSSQIIVKPENFDKTIDIVDASINAGSFVSYINLELSDEKQSEAKKNTLERASADARAKAEATARGLGKSLGSLVSIKSEDFYYPEPVVYYEKSGADSGGVSDTAMVREAASSISLGKVDVSSSVIVEYRLRVF